MFEWLRLRFRRGQPPPPAEPPPRVIVHDDEDDPYQAYILSAIYNDPSAGMMSGRLLENGDFEVTDGQGRRRVVPKAEIEQYRLNPPPPEAP